VEVRIGIKDPIPGAFPKRPCLQGRTGFGHDDPLVADESQLTISIAISREQTDNKLLGGTLLLECGLSLDRFPTDSSRSWP
jgi:hypothetical protein